MYVGIDMGSVASKVVIINEDAKILSYVVNDTKADIDAVAQRLIDEALEKAHLHRRNISWIVSTGYGRVVVSFANENRTEILCHAWGVHHLFPSVRTIIDVGGQDSKAIKIDDTGRVRRFAMNDRCAAGTGRFTEVMAKALDVELDDWGKVVGSAARRTKISSICTVFAETEVISKMTQKVPLNEILAGVCESIVTRIFQLTQRLGEVTKDICFTGGVANNLGIIQVLEDKLGEKLLIPEIPQSTGALGAAFLAKKHILKE